MKYGELKIGGESSKVQIIVFERSIKANARIFSWKFRRMLTPIFSCMTLLIKFMVSTAYELEHILFCN